MNEIVAFRSLALSSICHSAGTDDSNTSLFRREPLIIDGKRVRVPMISGNGVRGVLRRQGAWLIVRTLELEGVLTDGAARALSSGGSRTANETKLTAAQEQQIRRNAHLGLFGWAGSGDIREGAIDVRKLIPVCSETEALTGVKSDVPAGQLTSIEQYTRHDTELHGAQVAPSEGGDNDEKGTTQMIYNVETLSSGAELVGGFVFRPHATEEHVDWFHACLRAWSESGGHLGGKASIGHGRITVPEWDKERADRAVQRLSNLAEETKEQLAWL